MLVSQGGHPPGKVRDFESRSHPLAACALHECVELYEANSIREHWILGCITCVQQLHVKGGQVVGDTPGKYSWEKSWKMKAGICIHCYCA